MRTFAPLHRDHPSVGEPCAACRKPFAPGDVVTLIVLGPGDDPELERTGMIDPISERDRIEAEDRPLVADRYGDEARLGWPVLLSYALVAALLLAYVGMMIWGVLS